MNNIKKLLLIPHIKIHNANALSSPFTIGFPAMSAWLGAAHALQRKLNACGFAQLSFTGVSVISHHCDLQTHKGTGDYVYSIIGTGNPLDKSGERSAFIEEARCHLDVSLLIEYSGLEKDDENSVKDKVAHFLNSNMKIAGGDILRFYDSEFFRVESGNINDMHMISRKLMPGYALIERRDLMISSMEQGQDAIDALLDHLATYHSCESIKDSNNNDTVLWKSKRKVKGWIIPIATGFHGISELGYAKNQRDPDALHRFAESLVTLGEFKMAHTIKSIDEMLWHYQTEESTNLYLCTQSTDKDISEETEFSNLYD